MNKRFTFNTIALFTRANKPIVDFYTKVFGFTTDWELHIRLETPKDYREVEELTREAFWNVYAPGCVEHFVLHHYRSNPDFIPELDFVMEEGGRIIGHVMYSKAEIIREDGSAMPAWTAP